MRFESVSIIGLGYIGLPTAAVFASKGLAVVGVDINAMLISQINSGSASIVEPDLDALVKKTISTGHLRASSEPAPADAFIIAVPTPFKDNYVPDLSYIKTAVNNIAPVLSAGNLVVLESTSPVGTTEKIQEWIKQLRPDLKDIHYAYCPERVIPGNILHELVHNDRIVGGLTPKAGQLAQALYNTFVKGKCIVTDARTAEMTKLTENAFRDVNIAFANELSVICDKLEIDVWQLIQMANRHPRVNILSPGPGVGGHCIAVDPWFIVNAAPDMVRLIRAAREVNNEKPLFVVDKIKRIAEDMSQPTIVFLGLSYKANVDDVRESPAIEIVSHLAKETMYRLIAVEPHIRELPLSLAETKRVAFATLEDALALADIVVLLVDHDDFKSIPYESFANKKIIDTRGVFSEYLQTTHAVEPENA